MNTFPAWLATESDKGPVVSRTELTTDDLMDGDVTVK
ncbi:MAG: oxidoreductase, partial [Gammaproteobacteria bacterium]|nr:oxidoreductase [Gammaproteobacteria bacterium]